jgi:hypothetical protein
MAFSIVERRASRSIAETAACGIGTETALAARRIGDLHRHVGEGDADGAFDRGVGGRPSASW